MVSPLVRVKAYVGKGPVLATTQGMEKQPKSQLNRALRINFALLRA